MPTFETPDPIAAVIELSTGDVRVTAGDRTDTFVEVRPGDELDDDDVETAEATRVEYANGRLLVKAPASKGQWWRFRWGGSIRVIVELPAGSRLDVSADQAEVRCVGPLGETGISTSSGEVELDRTGRLRVTTGDGDVTVARAAGHAQISTADGEIRVGDIDGPAALKTANGSIAVAQVSGEARLNTAHGNIAVGRALAGVDARTASGDVTIRELRRGSAVLKTSYGQVEAASRRARPPGSTSAPATAACAAPSPQRTGPSSRPARPSRCGPGPAQATS